MEKIKPIVLIDEDTNERYTLEFSRDSVKYAERQGFDIGNIKPMTGTIDLFYYAFRMHHMRISREQAEKILFDKLGGMSDAMLNRLIELYQEPFNTLMPGDDEPKNSKMTVEM